MATLGEIMAAKGQKFPKIDDTYEDTPETRAPSDDADDIKDAPSKVDAAPAANASPAPSQDSSDLDKLQGAMAASSREADADTMFRRASALASLGRQNPDQIDTKDIEARRNAPLEMYKTRQAAKKQAAESALAAAHARYFEAETAEIPKREARERKKLDADIQDAQDRLEEAKRAHDQEAYARAQSDLTQLTMERERQQGDRERATPFETTTRPNPITGELETIQTNKHTGETRVIGGGEPPSHDVLEHAQARHAGLDKPLDALDQTQDALTSAEAAVRAHPESFDSVKARAGEIGGGLVPLLGPALAQRLGPALRGEAGQAARVQALQAAAGRIHEIAGTRGFSQTERATMATLVPNENDDSATVIRKLQQAAELAKRASDRLRSKLPVNNPPAGVPQGAKQVNGKWMWQDPQTGKVMTQ